MLQALREHFLAHAAGLGLTLERSAPYPATIGGVEEAMRLWAR